MDSPMSNVVTLHGEKRWKAVIEYRTAEGAQSVEHYLEEISDLHLIIEHGPDWNFLIRRAVTLNRADDGEDQNSASKALREERTAAVRDPDHTPGQARAHKALKGTQP